MTSKLRNKALVVGSTSFDIIFSIHGNIKDELQLKDGKLDSINLMFTAQNKEVYYGGTGGNIAYGLGLLKSNPILFSVVGQDFHDNYKDHCISNGIDLKVCTPNKDTWTATYYGISDEKYQQIGIWQPNVYGDYIEEVKLSSELSKTDFEQMKIAIFSPGTGISTRNHMLETYKKTRHQATIIFDPSQVLSIFYDKVLLKECLSLTDILISNDTEISQFESLFGFNKKKILDTGVKYIIETKGEKGSIIYSKSGQIDIAPVKPKKVVETTGAGDAYRAGL
ncbi:MAG: PfkB family carbohydrate kinase, partial [Patescibacteria group bacterium]|nr:PfkB family carbohydrate kinase [Patescibacteria group bacterium]